MKSILTIFAVLWTAFVTGQQQFLRLRLSDLVPRDEIVIGFDSLATNEYDEQLDAIKFLTDRTSIWSVNNSAFLSINVNAPLTTQMYIPISLFLEDAGSYSISLESTVGLDEPVIIYLEDTYTNTRFNLRDHNYNFSTTTNRTSIPNRYNILVCAPPFIKHVSESCRKNDGLVAFFNPSNDPWALRLWGDNDYDVIVEEVFNFYEFRDLKGGEYFLEMHKPDYVYVEKIDVEVGVPVVASFTAPTQPVKPGKIIVLQAQGGRNLPLPYFWDMGEGTTFHSDSIIEWVYHEPGIYTVTMMASNGSCSDVHQENITVIPGLITNINYPYLSKFFSQEKIEIWDTQGRLLSRTSQEDALGMIEKLEMGMYLLIVETQETRWSRPFLKK